MNRTSGEVVLASSMVLAHADCSGHRTTLLTTSRELRRAAGTGLVEVGGVQMWRMAPLSETQDEEEFMTSGSML